MTDQAISSKCDYNCEMDETSDDDSGDDWDEITEDFESIPCLFL